MRDAELSVMKEIPERIIRAKSGLVPIDFHELWRYRELALFLAWRNILVRYKQTLIGVVWAVIQPVLIMVVFTIIFGKLGKFDSKGVPYAVMTYAGVLPWQLFANAMSASSMSVVGASNMVSKVYFPRALIPVSSVLSAIADFLIAMTLLFGIMLWFRVPFTMGLLLLPLFSLMVVGVALGMGLWLSALNVKYRDVKHTVPFLIRVGMYVTPVGFMSDVVPERWRLLYSLNPLVGAIDGFRWAILGEVFEPYWPGLWLGVTVVILIVISGSLYFSSAERSFADII